MTTTQTTMTNSQAQELIRAYLQDWFENIGSAFVEDSINGSCDAEAKQALEQVGMDFNWNVTVSID